MGISIKKKKSWNEIWFNMFDSLRCHAFVLGISDVRVNFYVHESTLLDKWSNGDTFVVEICVLGV